MLSAILYGLRTSLLVGFVATGFAAVTGTTLGLVAGLDGAGGSTPAIMRLVDLQLSIPSIMVALTAAGGAGAAAVDKIILALALVQWA